MKGIPVKPPKHWALNQSIEMLEKLITHQPDITTGRGSGENVANFCIKFIETYSAWLEQQDVWKD